MEDLVHLEGSGLPMKCCNAHVFKGVDSDSIYHRCAPSMGTFLWKVSQIHYFMTMHLLKDCAMTYYQNALPKEYYFKKCEMNFQKFKLYH